MMTRAIIMELQCMNCEKHYQLVIREDDVLRPKCNACQYKLAIVLDWEIQGEGETAQ